MSFISSPHPANGRSHLGNGAKRWMTFQTMGLGESAWRKVYREKDVKKYPVASMGQRNTLRKQSTFRDASTGLLSKGPLRNERRNSILMTCQYTDLGSASDWMCREGSLPQPIRSTIPDLGSDTSSALNFCAESRHYTTPPLVSQRNDVWKTSAYAWRLPTHIWIVLLISWRKFSLHHDQSEAIPRSG